MDNHEPNCINNTGSHNVNHYEGAMAKLKKIEITLRKR